MVNPELTGTEQTPLEIPGYQLLEPIGEGGMGKVYRALQVSLQRTVAVKLLTIVPGQHFATAFQRESRLMASLAHPNLVTVFDCGQVKDHYYIVTELVRGPNLRPMIVPGQPWPIERACAVIDRIACALSYIHGKDILHLDLKPENILCNEQGEPKITDFGLALAVVDAQAAAEQGPSQGTLDYCAPEQRFGLLTSKRSDLFSLAVLAYELLTGDIPGRVYQSACQINPSLPSKVDQVLRRGLARSPEDRFGSVEEFRRDLIAALQGGVGQRRRRVAMCVALALVLGMSASLAGYMRKTPDAAPVSAAESEPIQAWIVHDRPEQLRWFDRDGKDESGGLSPQPLLAVGFRPNGSGTPPLPIWPNKRPVLVISSPQVLGFIHPLSDPTLGRRVLSGWRQLIESPPIPSENNFCRAGNFSGDCLVYDNLADTHPWRIIDPASQTNGDQLMVADPPDQPGNPALCLIRKDAFAQTKDFGVYQWLARTPERVGTMVVIRYRARAEEGEGRLCVRAELPILMPLAVQDETALRLRGLSEPLPELTHGPDEEARQYWVDDWVTPGREWQTYYTIWEWPPYCQDPRVRNIVILYAGTGKVWLDDLEIFTWELGGAP